MKAASPQLLGLKRSFGYGDRLGVATPGHLAANRKFDFEPIFAQQSIREMTRTRRTPDEVIEAASRALDNENYQGRWGADADHLKTEEDVIKCASAGFTLFTIDPSEYVNDGAQDMSSEQLVAEVEHLYAEGFFKTSDWDGRYLGHKFLVEGIDYRFDRERLYRAAAKYGRALNHYLTVAGWIAAYAGKGNYETEISMDETTSPTTPLEHLFIARELSHRGVPIVSLAPRFPGRFESGIDYEGDLNEFEESLKQHAAIARAYGPYKISIHQGSDKFDIYPIIGRVCGDLLHVKTAGTSYLEALLILFRENPKAFRQVVEFSGERFAEARTSYFVSTTEAEVRTLLTQGKFSEEALFEGRTGRQLLHVTYGAVLSEGKDSQGRSFREILLETLEEHSTEYRQRLEAHFDKHLAGLCEG